MKLNLSYFFLSLIIIVSVSIGLFIWRNQELNEISKFSEKSFSPPISSHYIPTNADLIFHWKINPTKLPGYIENYQDKVNKNITKSKINLIRDSSFNLISLDFKKDISQWVGDYGSFAIFERNNNILNDWLMVLEINKDLNRDFGIDSLLEQNFTFDNINSSNKSNISSSNIISKKIDSNQIIHYTKNKEHFLISSNPELIKLSINKLDSYTSNTKKEYKSIQLKDNLNDGILLLEMTPNKVFKLIGQEKDLLEINQAEKLITSINKEKNNLNIEGILSYDVSKIRTIGEPIYNLNKMGKEPYSSDNFILVNNPKQYFISNSINPYKKLIESLILQSIKEDYSNLTKIILEKTKGNLIWLKDKDWLAITNRSETEKKEINDILRKDKFLNSNLEFKNKNYEVWTKLTTSNDENYEIEDNIEAIIIDNEELYFWSKDLLTISNFQTDNYVNNKTDSEYESSENNDFYDVVKIHLGKEKTEVFLNKFYPYILLNSMMGNKLDFPQTIDISIAIPAINYPDFIKFKINLKTG